MKVTKKWIFVRSFVNTAPEHQREGAHLLDGESAVVSGGHGHNGGRLVAKLPHQVAHTEPKK